MEKTMNTYDHLTPANFEGVAKILGETGLCDKRTLPRLEDRIAVVQMMTTEIHWPGTSRWDSGGTDCAPWRLVQDATRGWRDFGDLLSGDAFLGVLARCLDFGGSGNASTTVDFKWNASPAEIIEAVRAEIVEGMEDDFVIDEDDEAILSLPPVLLVAVQLRMEEHFMDCVREQPELIVGGSVESLQKDIQKRWGKVITAIIESRREKAA